MKKLALAAYILLGTAGNNRPLISIAGGSKYLTLAALKFLECLRIVKMTGVGGERGRKIYSLVSRIFKWGKERKSFSVVKICDGNFLCLKTLELKL